MPSAFRLAVATVLVLAVPSSCSDPTRPQDDDDVGDNDDPITAEGLVGPYAASTFSVTEASGTEDLLAGGSSIDLTLNTDGSTSGRLLVPGGNEDGSDFDADLQGTWTLQGSEVSFDHAADTFIRDMPFTTSAGKLTGERMFGSATIKVVLTRQ